MSHALSPLSLYIHIPFCIHKCSYCDFYSIGVGQRPIPDELYVQRLCEELQVMVATHDLQGRELTSIFFGGGTPSMVRPELLGRVLEEVQGSGLVLGGGWSSQRKLGSSDLRSIDYQILDPRVRGDDSGVGAEDEITPHASRSTPHEITCEANPETLTPERLEDLHNAGITRLSIGVQSFNARHLQFMERIHSADRAMQAVRDAKAAGFDNINIDLIFGQPDQTQSELDEDLAQALAQETQHIAAYQLTVEPQTPLAQQVQRGDVVPLADDRQLAVWQHVRSRLQAAGYDAYEVSNYAKPGYACVHNQHYWRGGDYLGIGTGAVSRIGTHRWRRARHLKRYLAGELVIDEEEHLSEPQRYFEHLMLGLRTTEGIDADRFEQHYPGKAAVWIKQGVVEGNTHLRCTPEGLAMLESYLMEL